MRFLDACRLTPAVSLGICVLLGLVTVGCGKNTPTSPTSIDSIAARSVTDVAGTANFASVSSSARSVAAAVVEWECFAGLSASCPSHVSATGVVTGEVVTTPPGNLTRTVQGTTVVLSWGVPPGSQPTSYVIQAGSASGLSDILVFNTGNTATGLTVPNVPPGTYFVRVRGRDAAGNGPASNEVTVVVGSSGPAPAQCIPLNLTAVAVGSELALNWDEPPGSGTPCGSNTYLVQVGSSPGASNVAQVSTPGLIGQYFVSGAPPGTYFIRVRSQGPGGVSAPSNEVVVTVTGITPPGTTTWTGLAANGEGFLASGDDCGQVRGDLTLTIVQSGTSVTGISRIIVRSVTGAGCQALVGFTLGEPFAGTITGQFPNGAGTFSVTAPSGAVVSGSYANGRMTGTVFDPEDPPPSTFIVNRQ